MKILEHPSIRAFFERHAHHTPGRRPIAVFDCDGTVVRGDVGEAMLYYQLERFLFRKSPGEIWSDHPMHAELSGLYDTLCGKDPASFAESAPFHRFADMVLSWYFGQIAEGEVQKACADIVRLFAGYTVEEVRAIARDSFQTELASPPGKRRLGERHPPRGIRYITEAVELIRELQRRGFEIWAVSGSNKWSVEPVFSLLGIDPRQVVGIELQEAEGVLTPVAVKPIPIRQDKIGALKRHTGKVPLLVASDSRNDLPLFLYSSDMKVRINSRKRDTAEFFSSSGITPDEHWVLVEEPTVFEEAGLGLKQEVPHA